MTDTPDTLRPGHYLLVHPKNGSEPLYWPKVDTYTGEHGWINHLADPRALGYTIHSLEGLLAQGGEIKRLRERLAEEIRWGHRDCTPDNCTSSGVECPATPQGEEKP